MKRFILLFAWLTASLLHAAMPFQPLPNPGISDPRSMSGLAAWYDASDASSVTRDSANRVSLWADKSGNSALRSLSLNGATGNYASTPDSAALDVVGDLDLRCELRLANYAAGASQTFLVKGTGGGTARSYQFVFNSSGGLAFLWVDSGTNTLTSTWAAPGFTAFSKQWLRVTLDVDNGAGGRTITFYTSTDGTNWTQGYQDVQGGGTTSIYNSSSELRVGCLGASEVCNGQIYRAQVYNGINGTLVFDANFTAQAKLVSSFTESSSNAATVTINTSGDIGARISGERDLVQLTVSKQPVYLAWSGQNYGYLNGGSGNYFSTPNAAANQLANDLVCIARAQLNTWVSPTTFSTFIGKWGTVGSYSYHFYHEQTTGKLVLQMSAGGASADAGTATSTAAVPFTNGATYWLKAERNRAAGTVSFWYAADTGNNVPPSSWTQLGTTITGLSTATLFNTSQVVEVGSEGSGTNNRLIGRVMYASLGGTIGGAEAQAFDSSRYLSGSTFAASTGETWTLNGSATIVTRTGIYFDGSDDYVNGALGILSGASARSIYGVYQNVKMTAVQTVFGMSSGGAASSWFVVQNRNGAASDPYLAAQSNDLASGSNPEAVTKITTATYDGSTAGIRKNRLSPATAAKTYSTVTSGFTVGAATLGTQEPWCGNAHEFILFSTSNAAASQDSVTWYASRKWNLGF